MDRSDLRRWSRWALAVFFVFAGVNHFRDPSFYEPMMPPYLPAHGLLIALSGLFEIVGGVGVLPERTRRPAGWGLIALLVAVFPANVHLALNPDVLPGIPAWALWLRLPLQGVLIYWAFAVAARRDGPAASGRGAA